MAPLAAAGISFLGDFIFGAIQKKIEKRKAGLTAQTLFTGVTQDTMVTGQCIRITAGEFGRLKPKGVDSSNGKLNKVFLQKAKLADYPEILIELKTKRKDNLLTLTPSYIFYRDTQAATRGKGEKKASLVIALARNALEGADNLEKNKAVVAVFRHNLGTLEIGGEYVSAETPGLLSGTESKVVISDENLAAGVNLLAVLTESEDQSLVMSALTDAFGENSDDLKSAFEGIITDALNIEAD